MISGAIYLGGFIRWLIKGCRTKLKDEVEGNLEATWGRNYEVENYIIGIITTVVIIGLIVLIFFS